MRPTSEADLDQWNDPDDLLRALGRIGDEQKGELRDAVVSLLDHDDADVREEAMRRLFVGWRDRQWRARAVDALRADEAPEVRSVAAYAVAATSVDATYKQDVGDLIGVLKDEDEDPLVRGAAYDALLILHRRPEFPTKRRQFDADADVDWGWVQSLMDR
jgi:vesicle coat complex subunit